MIISLVNLELQPESQTSEAQFLSSSFHYSPDEQEIEL